MISTYNAQIEQIIKRTEEEAEKDTKEIYAQVAMFKIMIGAISKYVEKESSENDGFNEALSYEWKSAERMLKFVWGKAQELALPANYSGLLGAACCLPDHIVYDWVNEYYFLDDKEAVEKERAEEARKKAEAEAKKKADEEKMALARVKAIEKLSKEIEGWADLPGDEKEKKIAIEASKIKNRLGKKSASTKTKKKAAKKAETVEKTVETSEEDKTNEDISTAVTEDSDSGESEVADKPAPSAKAAEEVVEEESDFTLFDLMKMKGGDL